MSGIDQSVILDVCRLRAQFVDSIGNTKKVAGTGFWLKDGPKDFFVTNKHNLDPSLMLGDNTSYKLFKMEVELRAFDGSKPSPETKFFEVDQAKSQVYLHATADAAVLFNPSFYKKPDRFRGGRVLAVEDLADPQFLDEKIALMDAASFIVSPALPSRNGGTSNGSLE